MSLIHQIFIAKVTVTMDTCCGHTAEIMANIKDWQYLTQNCQSFVHKFFIGHTSRFYPEDFLQNLINFIFQSSHTAFCWILALTRDLGNQSG